MEKIKTEGIVINAIPFQNYDCILTLFTPNDGLIKLFYKGGYRPQKGKGSGAMTPLAIVEVVCSKGRGDFYYCTEISVFNANLPLRNSMAILESACQIMQALAATQQPKKSAIELYQLLLIYLDKLPSVQNPKVLAQSFKLKLLRYEGLFSFLSHCSICSTLLEQTYLHASEAFCATHTPSKELFLTQEERGLVELLAFGRDWRLIGETEVSFALSEKINTLFDSSF